MVRRLRASCRFHDLHVHPYEMLFDRCTYEPDPSRAGALSVSGKAYHPPAAGEFNFQETTDLGEAPRSQRLLDIAQMLLKKVYGSVGEPVFHDHMELAGMDRALLLPVPLESASGPDFLDRMRWVKNFYGNEERFWIAGGVPPSVPAEEIRFYARELKQRFGIKALKCHTVVSGHDLGKMEGRQWLEMLLLACRELKLPLILHGGRHNAYWGGERGDFGSPMQYQEINFSLSDQPVVIAHGGVHRCSSREISEECLPILRRMLNRHDNLYLDSSGLGFEPLKVVLQGIEMERLFFGSDALYLPQWQAVALTMHALKELGMKQEESFVQLASSNPGRIIFKDESHDQLIADQVEPVFGSGAGAVAAGGVPEVGGYLSAAQPGGGAGIPRPVALEAEP
jgi:predicted TIM-barrel fold metal-dependent hydrolase